MPKWIKQARQESDIDLSTDAAVAITKAFLRTMAQPFVLKEKEGISMWNLADLRNARGRGRAAGGWGAREGVSGYDRGGSVMGFLGHCRG